MWVYIRHSLIFLSLWILEGCEGLTDQKLVTLPMERQFHTYDNMTSLFPEPVVLFGNTKQGPQKTSSALWYGALRSLDRMPLEIADAERGFIQTQWYAPPGMSDHRLQIKVSILPVESVRIEAITVVILHQILKDRQWILIPVSLKLEHTIKRNILMHARQYYTQTENSSHKKG
jgi:hypothetical protein